MSQVKRFRADHRHVVETEFDDAQFVSVADYDALQQRLTVAEQFVQKLVDCSKGQDSIATGYLSDILDSLKPAEGKAS